ncbi:tail fiber protein [Niabella yanshanensis]|uniref:Tail fiber protein n=1 Tax=Niabella yanshanensis TaxID=577386 RepID=A0ABZ0VZW2_9BACT|nr:tail fiber protein [Niabella yanshanensis]WQD36471.1 tail fiber protein [Niabella yanshanensis]
MNPLLGMIAMFAFNRIPVGWALCNGQLLSIAEYEALFTLIGTTYGGDGQSTFAVPDLRGRVPIHQGTGPGLSPRTLGEKAGTEAVTLITSQLPVHNHSVIAVSDEGDTSAPAGTYLAHTSGLDKEYKVTLTASETVQMNAATVALAGGTPSPFSIVQPILAINFCISLYGIFPSTN